MNIHPAELDRIRRIAAEIREVDPDDPDLMMDGLEGESAFMDLVGDALIRMREAEAEAETNRALAARYTRQAEDRDARAARLKRVLAELRRIAGHNIKHPLGTVVVAELKSIPQRAGDFDADALPDDLVQIETVRKPDGDKIRAAMDAGRNVPGYQWSGPRESVRIK